MKLEYETKSACRIMVDLLSDDTVNTIQNERADCSQLLFFQHEIYHFKAYETAASALAMMMSIQRCMMINVGKWSFPDTLFSVCAWVTGHAHAIFTRLSFGLRPRLISRAWGRG